MSTYYMHMMICMYLCKHRVVCMLNVSYTFHFDSIGVRDRIVHSFRRRCYLFIHMNFFYRSRVIFYFYMNGILNLRVSFCLHYKSVSFKTILHAISISAEWEFFFFSSKIHWKWKCFFNTCKFKEVIYSKIIRKFVYSEFHK